MLFMAETAFISIVYLPLNELIFYYSNFAFEVSSKKSKKPKAGPTLSLISSVFSALL